MFKHILVAVDGSEFSHRALKCANALAERFEAALCLVHIYTHTADFLGYADFEKLVSKRKKAGQAVLDEARRQLGDPTFNIQEELLEGPEAESILHVAESQRVDLIVMGRRGFGSLKGLLLGSVSNKVMQHAPCPVMVVR